MTKKSLQLVFAAALFSTTLGCPPPAPEEAPDVDTGVEVTMPDDNMTATTEMPSDNMTATTETP
ncbi:MAG: hypothetical protein AAGJ40_18855 [Planctomycetota bacterium]